jgi:predicted RNA-binding protein Jag
MHDKEATATGRTVEEALEAACEMLGKAREDIEFEIWRCPEKDSWIVFHTRKG